MHELSMAQGIINAVIMQLKLLKLVLKLADWL